MGSSRMDVDSANRRRGIVLAAIVLQIGSIGAAKAASPTAWQDDASLYDVRFATRRVAWACGDHGAVWKTTDGGATWTFLSVGTPGRLASMAVVDEQRLFAAGHEWNTAQGRTRGVVHRSRDGGASWTKLTPDHFPPVVKIQAFDADELIVLCEVDSQAPTGLWKSSDGGAHWQPIDGVEGGRWLTGWMFSPELGAVAGRQGRISLVGDGRLLAARLPPLGGRSIRAMAFADEMNGVAAGDGGLLMRTESGGVVWESVEELPTELRDVVDFQTVAIHGSGLWAAGAPGGMVWHQSAAGRPFVPHPTGTTLPIHALSFASDAHGLAVGAMGQILTTNDGGATWKAARGGGRRAALLAVRSSFDRTSLMLHARYAGDEGYRTVEFALHDDSAERPSTAMKQTSIDGRVASLRGYAAQPGWQFPLNSPDVRRRDDLLRAEWNRSLEGNLGQGLLGRLVREIRQWRPSAVVVDAAENRPLEAARSTSASDAVERLILEALPVALECARDASRCRDSIDLGGLAPWNVACWYRQMPAGSGGDVVIEGFDWSHAFQRPLRNVALESLAEDVGLHSLVATREVFRREMLDASGSSSASNGRSIPDLLAGLNLAPNGPARRAVSIADGSHIERQLDAVKRQRNAIAIIERNRANRPKLAACLAETARVAERLPEPQAVQLLMEYLRTCLAEGDWELAESAARTVVEKHPDRPEATRAAVWLIQLWTSDEICWLRLQSMNGVADRPLVVQADGRDAGNRSMPLNRAAPELTRGPVTLLTESGASGPRDQRNALLASWRKQAAELEEWLKQRSPDVARSPSVAYPLATLRRHRGSVGEADRLYQEMSRRRRLEAGFTAAERESWLMLPREERSVDVARAKATRRPPHLDGLLSDDCWQVAATHPIVKRAGEAVDPDRHPFVQFSYDAEHLYLGWTFPNARGVQPAVPNSEDRTHDADLTGYDRIRFCLDVDRDYHTAYEFHIDARGQTRDLCWNLEGWNPDWFVAVDADELGWRGEAAIPLNELRMRPRSLKGDAWAVSVTREIPGIGRAAWPGTPSAEPTPDSYGLVRFE